MLSRLFRDFSYRVLPGLCLCCGLPSNRPLDLCAGCEAALPTIAACCPRCAIPLPATAICGECLVRPPPFTRILACHPYSPPVSGLILALKQHRDLAAGQVLGKLLAQRVRSTLASADYPQRLVPVPLHWRRCLGRGFNQALELARPVSRELGIALTPGAVRRTRAVTQQGLDREARRRQLRGAFAINGEVNGEHVAVIDDVVTTTGTVRALAQALTDAGARRVEIWCLARTALEK